MTRITISMPDAMGDYVNTRIESGQYGNVSEYIRDLIRREQEASLEHMRAMIDAGDASGTSDRSVEQIFDESVARARGRGLLNEDA
jgi:antitoxin ParD1/3/4